MKEIQKGGLRRRLALGAAGARGGIGLLSSRASGLLLPNDQKEAHNDAALRREAMRFVGELGALKGAYVKIGQMLALYGEHILPRVVTDALHTLEAQTKPLDWSTIRVELEASLGSRYEDISVDQSYYAAASLAQVHKASLSESDKALCMKIQYPGIAKAIDDDFKNVMQMLALSRWIKSGRQLDELAKELKAHLVLEVDYRHELATAQRVAGLLGNDTRYLVPTYYSEFCNKSLLTMGFIDGYSVNSIQVQALSQERRNKLAMAMLDLFFKEAFEWGLMQTDPNFGNYRILIDEQGENDRLVLLDFGAVHDLPDSFTKPLKQTILAAHKGDIAATIAGSIELKCLRETDKEQVKESFAQFCCFILEPFKADMTTIPAFAKTYDGLYDWQASRLLKRAGKLGSEGMLVKGFVIPPSEFMLMVRKLTGVFTFVSALGATLNSTHLLERYQ